MVRRPGAKSESSKAALPVPAAQAFFFQLISFFILLLLLRIVAARFSLSINLLGVVLLQGVIAAALSYWRRLAWWWLVIQLLFPVVLLLTLSLQLPPTLFLSAFLFFLFLYWTTFRTQVPFYPSHRKTWDDVAALLPQDRDIRFIDIGSGLGGLILHLAEHRTDSRFTGIEIAPLPWLVSLLRARCRRSQACFSRGDYRKLNFAEYDVVFAYLSPAAMSTLWEKAWAEMRPGSMLLSYEFAIPAAMPSFTVQRDADDAKLYVWHM